RVDARWGMVTSNVSIGVLPKPTGADALPTPSKNQCASDADLTNYFGTSCGNHEATAAGSASAGQDTSNGDDFGRPKPTKREERWFCSCPMVARVVVERCLDGQGKE